MITYIHTFHSPQVHHNSNGPFITDLPLDLLRDILGREEREKFLIGLIDFWLSNREEMFNSPEKLHHFMDHAISNHCPEKTLMALIQRSYNIDGLVTHHLTKLSLKRAFNYAMEIDSNLCVDFLAGRGFDFNAEVFVEVNQRPLWREILLPRLITPLDRAKSPEMLALLQRHGGNKQFAVALRVVLIAFNLFLSYLSASMSIRAAIRMGAVDRDVEEMTSFKYQMIFLSVFAASYILCGVKLRCSGIRDRNHYLTA